MKTSNPNADPGRSVRNIFLEAIAFQGDARERFVREACAGGEGLLREVRRLLAAHDQTGDSLIEEVARFLESSEKTDDTVVASAFAPGEKIGHYEILRVLGIAWAKSIGRRI
jgi:hypothetical protein